MATLMIPPLDAEPWPSLGRELCLWLEDNAVHGPGDVEGQRFSFTPEFRAQVHRLYEVFPRGHRNEGRRRFKTGVLEERKGTAKTERAMVIAFAEAHPEAPVRFDGWGADGRPIGRPMVSPYIPLVSYTVEQTEDLGYNVLRFIIENGPPEHAQWFDVGLERIVVLDARGKQAGKIVALAGSPAARDGARTTFQHFDEPHRMFSPRLRQAWSTMTENTYKRPLADAWTLTTSTAGNPAEESVQRDLYRLAEQVTDGKATAPRMFYFRRYTPLEAPLETHDDVRAAHLEASGPNVDWSADIDGLVERYFEPNVDRNYYRRVWFNQWLSGSYAAFDITAWRRPAGEVARRIRELTTGEDVEGCLDVAHVVPDGALIVLGFDGSLSRDATALIATEVSSGYQWPLGIWERPVGLEHGVEWEVPELELDSTLEANCDKKHGRYELWRLYGDPHRWRDPLARWAGTFGTRVVHDWDTTKWKRMAYACRGYAEAIAEGRVRHGGEERFERHVANCRRRELQGIYDEKSNEPLWVLTKDRPGEYIDGGVAAVLSWEARTDAITAGATATRKRGRAVGF